jgi:hypothetical protein
MSYEIPSAAAFKQRHPTFAAVADGTVTSMLAEAARSVSTTWSEGDYADAIMYLAAHMIAEENSGGGVSAASKAGPIKRVKADSVEIEYAGAAISDASLGGSIYGRRFLALRHRNAGRAIVV